MRAGYATLFSLVVAYSAYQGSNALKPGSSQQDSGTSRTFAKAVEPPHPVKLPAGAEPFPAIGGGICPLTVDGSGDNPCGDCKAICPTEELRGLIRDYFRAESESNKQYLASHWNVPHAEQSNIHFVIASLPDPVHTHMALLFDRGIETLQSAAQASGFLFSRAWMPWDSSLHSESTDFTMRLAQATFREKVESLPGLMIFQSTGIERTILFVFVVGETPTGGLHTEQFQNALNIRRSILAGTASSLGEPSLLRIYGPAFSGSLRSLDRVLNVQPDNEFSRIMIRSGSISSAQAVDGFCESTQEESRKRSGKSRPDFATFQFSDAYQEYYLGLFFSNREHLHSHVAILSEDETAFGNQDERKSEEFPDPCHEESPRPPFPFVRLYFPREIAQLRDAYQRDLKIQTTADGAKNGSQKGLALSLSVTGNDDDSVVAYSPLQTPLSQESILQGIVGSLRKQHAKVVVIRASDPLDMIFLSRYLRQNYPQARLVTVGADLLMVHDFYDPRFHGILAVTPYPLLPGTRFPTLTSLSSIKKDNDIQRLFPDSYSVGDFNAFRSLLATDAVLTYECLPPTDYAQFGLPSFLQPKDATKPEQLSSHLWLTVIGRDGYWPVAVLDTLPRKAGEERPSPTIHAVDGSSELAATYLVHFSVGWTVFWVITLGLTVSLAYFLAFPSPFSRSEIVGRFGAAPSKERNCLLLAASMLLLAAQTIFVFPAIVWLGRFAKPEEAAPLFQRLIDRLDGLWLVFVCYLLSVLALGWACHKGFEVRDAGTLARVGVIVCAAAALLTASFTWLMWSRRMDTSFGSFVYRYIHVGSGVSPALPLLFLLAAWLWWCWQSLTGVTSTKEKHMVLPSWSDFDRVTPLTSTSAAKERVPDAADRMRLKALGARRGLWPWKALSTIPLDKRITIPAVTGFVTILLLMWPPEIAEAFESPKFKLMYWVLLYSCLFLVCCLMTHIVTLWLEFRSLLQAIERVPFRRGFSDLRNLTWKPLWKLAGNGRQEFVQLLGSEVDALDEIRKLIPRNSELAAVIENVKDARNSVAATYEAAINGNPESAGNVQSLFYKLQDDLGKCASESLIYANEQWKTEDYTPPAAKQDQDKGAPIEPPAKNLATRSVEHFLCLFYLNVILVPLRRLQTLILAMAGVFVFVLISYSSYPFESRESFHALLIFIFFVISLIVGIVYGQMYTNPLLTRITNSRPGELSLDFWVRIGTFVFVPLLSLLSVQFPEINNFLFSWLQPALQSIK